MVTKKQPKDKRLYRTYPDVYWAVRDLLVCVTVDRTQKAAEQRARLGMHTDGDYYAKARLNVSSICKALGYASITQNVRSALIALEDDGIVDQTVVDHPINGRPMSVYSLAVHPSVVSMMWETVAAIEDGIINGY